MQYRFALLVSLVLVLAACSDAGAETPDITTLPTTTSAATTPPTTTPTTTRPADLVPTSYPEFRAQATACDAEQPPPVEEMMFTAPTDMGVDKPVTVIIETSCGPVTVELDPAAAPQTVNSFVFLAEQGFFDGSASHRIIPGFVIQAGDPTATGRGGPGYTLPDELPAADFTYARGTLAMANAGPGTTGSQFFIVVADVSLPPQFSVFGRVVDGFDVLGAIERIDLGTAPGSRDPAPSTPLESLYIERVEVSR